MSVHPRLANMMEVLVHHYNQASAMSREAAAVGMGLNPEPYRHPYPGSTNYTVNVVTPGEAHATAEAKVSGTATSAQSPTTAATPSTSLASRLLRWLPWVLAAVAAAGLAVTLVWWATGKTPVASAPSAVPPAATAPAGKTGLNYEVWERDEKGAWKRSGLTVEQLLGGQPLP